MSTTVLPQPESSSRRVVTAVVLLLLAFVGLFGRLVYVVAEESRQLSPMAHRQHLGSGVLPARRGSIFDARGRLLACSRLIPDVFVDPALVVDVPALAERLGPVINVPPEELTVRITERSQSRFVVLAEGVDRTTADAVRQLDEAGVGLLDRQSRYYPLGASAGQVLGFVGRDGRGLEGIELRFDDHLRGRDGHRSTVRDARRRALWRAGEGTRLPEDGGHLVLTLDAEIQHIAEELLEETVTQFEAESGVAIVMDPRTGDVLAMAVVPRFDPNQIDKARPGVWRNRAITDPVEPGSAFKPVVASGALDGGFVSAKEQINCHKGRYYIGRRLIEDTKPSDYLDLRGIIARSSNIGMSIIAERMGNRVLYDVLRRFGFGEPTGIECLGEDAGSVPLRQWTKTSTPSISFGYEVLVTPLQLLNAFAALANDGAQVRPRLIRERLATNGTTIDEAGAPETVRRVSSVITAKFMKDVALAAVVEESGGSKAQSEFYRVFGKTGTAKLTVPGSRGYTSTQYLSTFVGGAPLDDPRVVALVQIRKPNPSLGYYGGQVAAPAAGKLLERSLSYLGVPPAARLVSAEP